MDILNKYYLYHRAKEFLENRSFFGRKYLNAILVRLKPKINDGIIVYTKLKFKLKIYPIYDRGIERTIYHKGIYEQGTLSCFEKIIKKGNVIFDIGANIGLMSVYASILTGKNGRVYSFEPHPRTFQILNENIRINKLSNVKTFKLALSNQVREGFIYENLAINRGAASLNSNITNNEGISVQISTLDAFCDKYQIDQIDVLKLDIEGEEYKMLQGSLEFFKDKKPIICVEFSREVSSENEPEKLYKILKEELNYDLFKLDEGKEVNSSLTPVRNKSDLPIHDNLFCFQPYHYNDLPNNIFKKL